MYEYLWLLTCRRPYQWVKRRYSGRVRRAGLSNSSVSRILNRLTTDKTTKMTWVHSLFHSNPCFCVCCGNFFFVFCLTGRVNGSKDYVERHHDTILVVSVSSCDLVTTEMHIVKWVWQWRWVNQHQELFLLLVTWPKWDHRTCVKAKDRRCHLRYWHRPYTNIEYIHFYPTVRAASLVL